MIMMIMTMMTMTTMMIDESREIGGLRIGRGN
jgi:hypothetical protein